MYGKINIFTMSQNKRKKRTIGQEYIQLQKNKNKKREQYQAYDNFA